MAKRTLDTNVLINHWGDEIGHSRLDQVTTRQAIACAANLIEIQYTNLILTPVFVEFLCGHATAHGVKLSRAYLGEFEIADGGKILPADWEEAKRLAARVPRDGLRRQMGDCLIRAICTRLNLEVFTFEKRFPY
jgi:predicted nucleic acid-binding protein